MLVAPVATGLSGIYADTLDNDGNVLITGGFTDDFSSSNLIAVAPGGGISERARGFTFSSELFHDTARDETLVLDVGVSEIAAICRDADGNGVCNADEPCTGGVALVKPKLQLKKLDTPVGDDGLAFSGQMTVPTSPAIDPVTKGARLVVADASGTIADVSIPPGLVDPVTKIGWKPNKSGTSFKYANKAGLAGITSVSVKTTAEDAGGGDLQGHGQERRVPDDAGGAPAASHAERSTRRDSAVRSTSPARARSARSTRSSAPSPASERDGRGAPAGAPRCRWRSAMRRLILSIAASIAAATIAGAEPFADRVVTYAIGTGGGSGEAGLPGVVLGPPHGGGAFHGSTDTFSLGLGGSITLAFDDNVLVDGPGPDLLVFENAFLPTGLTTLSPFAEPAVVEVSGDGVDWHAFPCALTDRRRTIPAAPGCTRCSPTRTIPRHPRRSSRPRRRSPTWSACRWPTSCHPRAPAATRSTSRTSGSSRHASSASPHRPRPAPGSRACRASTSTPWRPCTPST